MKQQKWTDVEISPLQEYNAESHRVTLESIQQAMIALLQEKSFQEITILELVQKAGVSRSAFYRNYQSKEEVLQSIVHDAFAEMADRMQLNTDTATQETVEHALQHIIEQFRSVYSLIQSDVWQSGTMLQCMNLYFSDFFLSGGPNEDEMLMRFWMGGTYNAILFWLENGMQESPKQLAHRLLQYIIR